MKVLKNPYACSLCKKGFPKPELLSKHVETFHLPSKAKKTLSSSKTAPFQTNDRIFAKVKGYPAWPACVFGTNDVKGSRFKVYFYGTHETAIVKKEDMCFFEETTKVKFFKQKLGWLKKGFVEAIDEIENRPEIGYFKDANLEESSLDESKENKSANMKVEIKDEPMEDGAIGNANLQESKLDASILDESKENKSPDIKVEITDSPSIKKSDSKKVFSCMACNKNFTSKQSLKYHENSKIHQNASILDESEESKSPNIKVEIKDEPEKGYPAWPQSLPLKKRKVADYETKTTIKREPQTTPVKKSSFFYHDPSEDKGVIANNSDEFSDVDGEDNWKVQILPPTKPVKLKPHFCSYCDKKFSSNQLLKQHVRSHTGERPYSCNYCEKRFTQSHSLQSHEFIHTGEKPFSCKICSYSCRNSANLRKHGLIHTGEKLFSCMYCDKKFSTKQGQQTHEKSKMHQETEL